MWGDGLSKNMSKTAKILILLTFLALCLVLYLIFSAQVVTIKPSQTLKPKETNNKQKEIDLAKLTSEYEKNIKNILTEWQIIENQLVGSAKKATTSNFSISETATTSVLTTATTTADSATTSVNEAFSKENILNKLAALKVNLMSARVPEQFKGFHLKLTMALSDFKNALVSKNEQSEKEALKKITEAIEEYKKMVK